MPHHDVAALSDLPDGVIRPATAGEEPILLIRDGDTIHAIGGRCPHAGAPLEQGVRNGDRLVCPWHKATFCIRTGALLEPPAVDSLPHYAARIEGQRIVVTVPPDQPEPPAPTPTQPTADQRIFAIIGAGAAGALAAQTLRQAGFNGRIVMLDQ